MVKLLIKSKDTDSKVKEIFFDDGERIEIASSYPDVESAIKALHTKL